MLDLQAFPSFFIARYGPRSLEGILAGCRGIYADDRVCGGYLRTVIQVGVDVRCRRNIAVSQPFPDLFLGGPEDALKSRVRFEYSGAHSDYIRQAGGARDCDARASLSPLPARSFLSISPSRPRWVQMESCTKRKKYSNICKLSLHLSKKCATILYSKG